MQSFLFLKHAAGDSKILLSPIQNPVTFTQNDVMINAKIKIKLIQSQKYSLILDQCHIFIIDVNRHFWNRALVSIELLRLLLSFRSFFVTFVQLLFTF